MKCLSNLIFPLIFIASFSCQKQSRKQIKENISFKSYVKKLPQISLPYYFACDSSFIDPSWWAQIDQTDTLIKKYRPEYAGIVGKVYESDQSIGVLYTFAADIALPIIFITDTTGINLRTVELYELGSCWWEPGCGTTVSGQITNDLRVISRLKIIDCEGRSDTIRKESIKRIYRSGVVQNEANTK